MRTPPIIQWLGLGLALCAVPLAACDDGSAPADPALDQGASVDGGANGPCQAAVDCFSGQICVEQICTDCVADGECAEGPWGGVGACVAGSCCQAGTEGCACGAGCGDGLACERDRCLPTEPPCEVGTPGCDCSAARPCPDGQTCNAGACEACAPGALGCPCDGGSCADALICEAERCIERPEPMCDAAACAAEGRVCADEGLECGACDADAEFIDDGQGGCQSVRGGAPCDDDGACAEGTRCLALLPGRASTCVAPPACVDATNAWSAEDIACVACASCEGVTGGTGQLWPVTSRGGECVCETTDGYYYDVARAVQAPRPCDADADGWVQRPAHQYLISADSALQRNARCAPTTVATVRLVNERGEIRDLAPADLNAEGALVLYEPDTLDAQSRLDTADDIAPWGDARPSPAWLNPLTKLCVSATADFNGNGLSDLEERPDAELNERTAWMAPFLKLSHFAELHTTTIDPANGGTLIITERARCEVGFPLDTLPPERGAHWRECERRRSADYSTREAGFDLAAWSCDSDSGSCPGLTPAERAPEGMVAGACSGPATGHFTGMNHHSQFACLRMSQAGGAGRVGLLSDAGTQFSASRCLPDETGTAACAAEPEPADGAVLWTTALQTARRSDAYVNGCVPECGVLLPTCDAYDADPALNGAGCNSDATDFGKLECNLCPTSNSPCQLAADNPQGLLGVCRTGTTFCNDGQPVCEPDQLEPTVGVTDHFGDGIDESCDGFDGDLSRSLFVRAGGTHTAADDGSPGDPFALLSAAFAAAEADGALGTIDTIYLAHDTQRGRRTFSVTEAATLLVPSTVVAVIGGMLPAADCPGDTWCAGDGLGNNIVVRDAIAMQVGLRTQKLRLSRFSLTAEIDDPEDQYNAANGATHLALQINNPINAGVEGESCGPNASPNRDSIVLEDVTLIAAHGVDGQAAPDAGDALNGLAGEAGAGACRIAAGTCGHHCPENYWLEGQGGACACNSGAACGGGAGGLGGVLNQPFCMADPANLEGDPQNGGDGQGGDVMAARGGLASNLPCPGEENPLDRNGADGGNGDNGGPGAAGAGFYSTSNGWAPRSGAAGRAGTNGAGAGGGAGGAGSGFGAGRCPQRGGRGAGGGAGGCGGLGGTGGGSGGASIGLMVIAGDVCLINSTISAGDGGNAGAGATGQQGGNGGLGGRWEGDPDGDSDRGHAPSEWQTFSGFGARGGDGGDGGDGGNGGNGVHGVAHAVLLADANANVFLAPGVEPAAVFICGSDGLDVGEAELGPGRAGEDCLLSVAFFIDCQTDVDCPDHQRCIDTNDQDGIPARCSNKTASGEACAAHLECSSGYCPAETCVAQAALDADCPSDVDEACQSGACIDEVCAEPCIGNPGCQAEDDEYCQIAELAERGTCTAQITNGERCEEDGECISGACGTNDGVCFVPCDNDANCDADQWCGDHVCTAKATAGEDCQADVQCTSGACDVGGACLECDDDDDCEDGYCDILSICHDERGLGDDCARDLMCASGLCEILGEGCVPCRADDDCDTDLDQFCHTPIIGSNACITPRADGAACTLDAMCASDTCVQEVCRRNCNSDNDCPDDDYCLSGGCVDKLADGIRCGVGAAFDRVCASGVCDGSCTECVRGRGCSNNQYCEINFGGANSCEATRSNNSQCGADFQCTNGACVDGRCRTSCDQGCTNAQFCKSGGCVAKLANDVPCGVHGIDDDVCSSGVCDGSCTPCLEDAHCPGDQLCHVILGAQNACVQNLANGEGCGRDIECASDYCNLGVCQAKASDGTPCTGNRVCMSGICVGIPLSTCQACSNDDEHCGGNHYCRKPIIGLFSCEPTVANRDGCGRDRECRSRNCNFFRTCVP